MAKDVSSLTTTERVELAKAKMKTVIGNAIHLIELYEANEIITFSDTLSKQIPFSHAANAFNVFQDAMFRFEVVRLCVLWDPCQPWDLDKESLPAVIQLVDEPAVIAALREKTRQEHGAIGTRHYFDASDPPDLRAAVADMVSKSQWRFADEQAAKIERRLKLAIRWATQHMQSPTVQAMQNFRDKHIAHALSSTRMEKKAAKAGGSVESMKYRDARWLYRRTLAIADNLYVAVNGTSFDWSGSVEIARRNASRLWGACRFDLPARGA